jgi:hypothetical protein
MQGYSKGTMGIFMTVYYNALVEASKQGYSKGTEGLFMTLHYNAKLETPK